MERARLIGPSAGATPTSPPTRPSGLGSLDAIHLAAALDLGDDLEGLITYDDRLADAAASNGVIVVAPR